MAATPSTMIPLGSKAQDFNLLDTVSGKNRSLNELRSGKATLIMFICNHCPFVKHVNKELVKLATEYIPKGVLFIAISSNDIVQFPEDGPEPMKKEAAAQGYPFPYLFDESQSVARAYDAACTPDFFIYDKDLRLAYRGQLDDSRPSNGIPVTGKDIRQALDQLIAGQPVPPEQKPSIGCNIKWKKS
jgi:thiol-disulfide isomerase/thioredoxin